MAEDKHSEEKQKLHKRIIHKIKHSAKQPKILWIVIAVLSVILLISVATCGFRACQTKEQQAGEAEQLTELKDRYMYGNENSKVKIIEYSDFQCPFCARAVPILQQIKQNYNPNQVSIEFRQFPLSFHANAQKAAEASECAREQEKFAEYHDRLFANQGALDITSLKKYAQELGLDTAKFNTCLDNGDKKTKVQSDFNMGVQAGVTGTPTFFINSQKTVGAKPFADFKAVIDAQLG